MAGSASSQLRSAAVAEVTAGTTPGTPSFDTFPAPILMMATAQNTHQSALYAGGSNVGAAKLTLPVTGKTSVPLVYAVYSEWFASLLQGTWSTDTLVDGKARKTFTVENTMPAGIGGSSKYFRYQGVEAVGAQIVAEAGKEIMLNMDFVGMGSIDGTGTAISGATYTDPANKDPMASNFDVGAVTFAGLTVDAIYSLTMDLVYEGRDPQPQIGSDILAGVARGAFKPSIKVRFYTDANFMTTLNTARADHSAFKVTVNLGSVTAKKYRFEYWDCYMDMADPDWGGASSGFVDCTFIAAYSASNSAVLTLTRAIA